MKVAMTLMTLMTSTKALRIRPAATVFFSALLLALAFSLTQTATVHAQEGPAEPDEPEALPLDDQPIEDMVGAALLNRGILLFDSADFANAKKLFIESLESSPKGPSSERALTMLRAANEKLGIADLNDGRPNTGEKPVDPYAGGEKPVDPYAGNEKPIDPYAGTKGPTDTPIEDEPNRRTSRGLMAWGAGYGFALGMAIGGPVDDETDEVKGSALLLGLVGIGGGITAGYLASRKYPLSRGQVAAITSAGNWGMWNLGMMGDVFTGEGTTANQVYKFAAAGGALGVAAGAVFASKTTPSEGDVAMINSLGGYGTSAGLLLGVALSPPRPEAYSINAVIGSLGGLGVGLYLRDQLEMSRARTLRVDLGAALGAGATWGLLYPLIKDDDTNNDEQFAGFFSTLTMAGGIGVAYYLTRNFDKRKRDRLLDDGDPYPASAGLVRRSGTGTWSLGSPMLRPIADPALAPPSGFSMGVDVAAGRF